MQEKRRKLKMEIKTITKGDIFEKISSKVMN